MLPVAVGLLMLAGCDSAPEPRLVNHDDAAGNFTGTNEAPAPVQKSEAPTTNAVETSAVAPGELPAAMLGNWGGLEEDCSDKTSIFRLKVEPTHLRFFESVGDVRSVRASGKDAVVADIEYNGEGQSWQRRQTLSLSEGGARLTISGVGNAMVRQRCT